ncbi:MAG TPA: IS110 family transposase [Candidatus Cybelea sp.]|jgi:transposase|nr:IS110 family transposase [Candidatus Cybelea sp.]
MSQNTMTTIYTGLDIAKLNLQLHLAGRFYDLPNTAPGHRRLLKLLAARGECQVVCEATGGYERDVVAALQAAHIPVSVLNPARARHFAKASGQRAKTDKIDAALLTAYGQALQPKPTPARTALEQQLTELVRRRNQIVELIVGQQQQAAHLTVPALRRQAQSLIRRLQRDRTQIESQLKQLRQQIAPLEERLQKLEAIAGVGTITALGVLAELPELGTLNRRQTAALAGLAPFTRQSGRWQGLRAIGGGRAPVRRALYMAALVAARSNRQLKEFYQRLRAAGKPAKVALTAVMRKLIILMNQVLKHPNFVLQN